jgi:hypothetical protein
VNASGLPSPERLAYLLSNDLQSGDVPLWALVRHLDGLAPAASLSDKIRLAQRTLPLLLQEHDLWRGKSPGGPVAPMTEAEISAMSNDDTSWHDPEKASILVWLRAVR